MERVNLSWMKGTQDAVVGARVIGSPAGIFVGIWGYPKATTATGQHRYKLTTSSSESSNAYPAKSSVAQSNL